jgi:5'(3')-deoxyribonucleotidase
MMRRKLGLDLDDVLSYTTEGVLTSAQEQGYTIAFGDITSSALWEQHGIPEPEAIEIVHSYERSGYPGLRPVEGAQEGVDQLRSVFDLSVITARDKAFDGVTKAWLHQYFGDVFRSIVHVGNRYVSLDFREKSEVCAELEIDAMVDDSPKHVLACARLGIQAYLFGGYEWHKAVEAHRFIEQVCTWPDLTERLLKRYG